jgi:hypothetical protein
MRGLLLLLVSVCAGAQTHPRLIFTPGGRSFEKVRTLYRTDAQFRSLIDQALSACRAGSGANPAMLAACWAIAGDESFARESARRLVEQPISQSGSGSYSDVWSFALAWDWLYGHSSLGGGVRERAAARIAERLHSELALLDDTGMAMWHGRNQAANGAIVAALALAGLPGRETDLRRARAHYAEAVRALDFSEGWPEGPSYWIYNRALPYAVAADSYISATGEDTIEGVNLRGAMRKIGLWTLYQYGPNGIFEPYGDSVGSLRLGDTGMWEASADYFARLSRDPVVAAGADFLRNHSPAPYGKRPISWYAALAYDPDVRPRDSYDAARPELWLRAHAPQAMLFGRDSLGVAFLRGPWGDPDELFASFKAGDLLAHHDHYNAGHFTIQLGGLLAPLTGVYGASDYAGPYRLGYAVQTVASNSLLILATGETSGRAKVPLSGGQRVVNPTGFDCVSVADFKQRRDAGPLERATLLAFESRLGAGDYLAADITAAYNSTRYAEPGSTAKVSRVTRQFLYLRRERAFVVFDRVETTNPGYVPKFLLHGLSKPRSSAERLLAGSSPDDGILETADRTLVLSGERGVLTQRILLPAAVRTLKIGGPHYSGYVEESGSQQGGFRGRSLEPDPGKGGSSPKPRGLWRLEVEPAAPGTSHRFLNVLLPRLAADRGAAPEIRLLDTAAPVVAVQVGGAVAVMSRDGGALDRVELRLERDGDCWILDAHPGREYTMDGKKLRASAEGVLVVDWPRGRKVLR